MAVADYRGRIEGKEIAGARPRWIARAVFVIVALAVMLLWVITFVAIALLRDGCGLEYVLPWYDSAYNHCADPAL
jgi:hypothetical protein